MHFLTILVRINPAGNITKDTVSAVICDVTKDGRSLFQAGSVHVRIRRDADEQMVLSHVYHRLSNLISVLTVQVFKDDWSRPSTYQILGDTSILSKMRSGPTPPKMTAFGSAASHGHSHGGASIASNAASHGHSGATVASNVASHGHSHGGASVASNAASHGHSHSGASHSHGGASHSHNSSVSHELMYPAAYDSQRMPTAVVPHTQSTAFNSVAPPAHQGHSHLDSGPVDGAANHHGHSH